MTLEINKYKEIFEEFGKSVISNLSIKKANEELDFEKITKELLEIQNKNNIIIFKDSDLKNLFSRFEKKLNKIDNSEISEEEKLREKQKILFDLKVEILSKVFLKLRELFNSNQELIYELLLEETKRESFESFFESNSKIYKRNTIDFTKFQNYIFSLCLVARKIDIIKNREGFEISFLLPKNISLTLSLNPFGKNVLRDILKSFFEAFGTYLIIDERDEEIILGWFIQLIEILSILKLPFISVVEISKEKETINLIFGILEDLISGLKNIPIIETKINPKKPTGFIKSSDIEKLKIKFAGKEDISQVFVNKEIIFVYEHSFIEKLKTKIPYNAKPEEKFSEILKYCYRKKIVFEKIAKRNYLLFEKSTLLALSEKYGIEIPEVLSKSLEDGG